MPRPLANIWDTAALPTAIRTMVGTVAMAVIGTIVIIGTVVIVTAVGAILAMTRIVIVILTAVMVANATAIGAGAHLLVVIRPIIASARVTPEALPEAVAHLVQGTLTARMTALAGKFDSDYFVYVALRGHPWFPDERCGGTRLKCCNRKEYQCPSPIAVPSPSLLSFQSILQ
jgi:hypothetical protein